MNRQAIKNFLESQQRQLGRDQLLNIVDEWLHETAAVNDGIYSLEPADVDLDFQALQAGDEAAFYHDQDGVENEL